MLKPDGAVGGENWLENQTNTDECHPFRIYHVQNGVCMNNLNIHA